MTDIGPTKRSTEDLESRRAQVTEESPTSSPVSWRLRQKVSIPERMRGFVERPQLVDRCILADHRVSVLLAPAGFGKTTLLAESCRRLKGRGVHVAWLSLDALDEPAQLVAHLAFALTESGIQFGNLPGEDRLDRGPTEQRTNLLIRGIESHRASWVLALDGLENLTNRGSAELISFLVKWSPPNLRIAMACRALPPGLDTFNPLFEGKVSVLTANELRFSNTEIAAFLSLKATSPEVASIAAATEGWPIALRIHRNEWKSGAEGSIRAVRALAENWLDSWFWSRLSDANRRLLRDIGLFEWVDGELLDQVLETRELLPRLKAIPTLTGLFEPVAGAGSEVWALHPMIREHCAKRCFQEAPKRFEAVHLRLAAALARRGETISAIHHAATVGDAETVGRILNDHGGVRMWIRQGFVRLQAADRFVTEEVAELYPRVALMHCVVLCLSGRLEEAKQTYRALAGNTRRIDQLSAQEREQFRCDLGIVQGVMTSYGCELADSEFGRTVREYLSRMADERSLDPLIRSMYEYGLCVLHSYRADFDTAVEWANRAHQRARAQSPYLEMQLHIQMGSIAMARGGVKAAARCYSNGQRIAKSAFDGDPGALVTCAVMMRELEVERGRISPMRLPFPIPKIFAQDGCPFGSYTAACSLAVETTLHTGGAQEALATVRELSEHARSRKLPALIRYVSALHVAVLVDAGMVSEAAQTWILQQLPSEPHGCLDLEGQSWREMEAISCARVRLLTAQREFASARRLARELTSVAENRNLRRVEMRAWALKMTLEQIANQSAAAAECLVRCLHLFTETDYAGPLIRELRHGSGVLDRFLDGNPERRLRESAEVLLALSKNETERAVLVPKMTQRETEILHGLETHGDKELARLLNLTPSGVRYHITKIFDKLSARNRADAVDRARRIGLLPEQSPPARPVEDR